MIELWGGSVSRWVKPYWMLKELGVEFKEHAINLSAGEQKTPAVLALNPFGKVPVMKDGDLTLFESTAILNYLGEKYPEGGLVPKSGTRDRAHYDQWMSFCITELEQPLWRLVKHTLLLPTSKRDSQDIILAREEFTQLATTFDRELGGKRTLIANNFTAADITVVWTLNWAMRFELLNGLSNCQRYCQENMARPHFPKHLYK